MSPPDLERVHPVILAWLRRVLTTLPDPPEATPAEASEAVAIERWTVKADRWGLQRIEGVLVTFDGFEFTFRVTPVAVDIERHLVWTSHGWMSLGSLAVLPEGKSLIAMLGELENWCEALRDGLRHG